MRQLSVFIGNTHSVWSDKPSLVVAVKVELPVSVWVGV